VRGEDLSDGVVAFVSRVEEFLMEIEAERDRAPETAPPRREDRCPHGELGGEE
jgi:hypothetical protein